jgi:hypothetical protein
MIFAGCAGKWCRCHDGVGAMVVEQMGRAESGLGVLGFLDAVVNSTATQSNRFDPLASGALLCAPMWIVAPLWLLPCGAR